VGTITDVAGIQVGHAENEEALTGCTVVVADGGATVGVDVRGAAPGTRETDLARPGTLVERADAVLLTGGSAFGLDAAGGVMRRLRERGQGFPTGAGPVPIVPGAVIYDLEIGEAIWPDAEMGYRACAAASDAAVAQGNIGAGSGATVGKILGIGQATKSGLGSSSIGVAGFTIGALVVVNALGDVVRPGDGQIVAGARDPRTNEYVGTPRVILAGGSARAGNTTLGVVATDAGLTSQDMQYLARIAHDGLARTIHPVHTMADGDTIFSLATGTEPIDRRLMVALGVAAVAAVEEAVLAAVRFAEPAGGLPAGRYSEE